MAMHVLPVNDKEEHEESEDCHCKPKIEYVLGKGGSENKVIVHNSFDGRELYEVEDYNMN